MVTPQTGITAELTGSFSGSNADGSTSNYAYTYDTYDLVNFKTGSTGLESARVALASTNSSILTVDGAITPTELAGLQPNKEYMTIVKVYNDTPNEIYSFKIFFTMPA